MSKPYAAAPYIYFMVSAPLRRKAFLLFAGLALILTGREGVAQPYVNIPDPVFRDYIDSIVPGAIVGNDLNTSHPGLAGVGVIDVSFFGISDLTGVQYFSNLTALYCGSNALWFLPPLPSGLYDLYCNNNQLNSLPTLPYGLNDLNCENNQLYSLPSLPSNLWWLRCSNNFLSALPSLPASLGYIWANNCSLTSLPALPMYLTNLEVMNNQLSNLPVLPNSLQMLFASGNPNLWCLPNVPTNLYSDIGTLVCTPQGTPGTWFKVSNHPGYGRTMALAVGIGDVCYLGTGTEFGSTNDWWAFDPATGSWTQKASLPGQPRVQATGFAIGEKAYVGLGQGPGPVYYLYDIWEYAPASNTWKQMSDYPGTGNFGNAAFSIGNKGYVGLGQAPGYLFPQEFFVFDPLADTWTPRAVFPGLGRCQSPCFAAGNKGYVIGGGWYNGLTSSSYVYDPVSDAWSAIASYPVAINEAAAFALNGKGYVSCGQYASWNGPVNTWLYEYDPAANGWIQCPDLPARPRFRTAGCAAGGRGYVGTGTLQQPLGGYAASNDWWEYTPLCSMPSNQIYASSNTTICQGDSVMLYADNGNTYQWKKNGSNVAGAAKPFYYAKSAGTYSCLITNSCSSVTSVNIGITVKPLPDASITTSGSTTICKPETVTLNAVAAANRSYQWKRNGVIIPGATASSLVVTQSGYYKVIVTNTNTGCSKTTGNAVHVIAYSKPSAKITPSGTVSFCAGQSALLTANSGNNYSYQWKKDGALIPGATNQTLTVTTAGLYKVIVTKQNGCSKVSKGDTVVVPCRSLEPEAVADASMDVRVSPNPGSGDFMIEFKRDPFVRTSIVVCDAIGQPVFSAWIHESPFIIHDATLRPGIYVATLTVGKETKRLRLVKQ